jgi:ubiquinone/menaquinone biosynthesis C-methylase UbiE
MEGCAEGDDILCSEAHLRAWFVRGCDPVQQTIDGLDIGWGGVQRWATARVPTLGKGLHLDLACGYATFLAELGWRFPQARLFGLNIDFKEPHGLARPLLTKAGVSAELVQADARQMPFADGTFNSASCFMGLQEVEIGFGEAGVRHVLREAVRVLRTAGMLVLLDVYPLQRLMTLMEGLPVMWVDRIARELDVRWNREVAMKAIALYAEGWVAQMRLPAGDRVAHAIAYHEVLDRMQLELEAQMTSQGYYVPFGPVRMVVVKKLGTQ